MSEQDPAEGGEPAEPEEPKIILTEADITAGLSQLYRIPSKFLIYRYYRLFRWAIIRFFYIDGGGKRPTNSKLN
jgi:hypothetical protein